ncbi:hypothetical protein Ana3638_03485 [Anaerocolumna sedimenticola]|uniref:Polysaccharide polymerase n=1 Tax=Anaerocolumna sedimenticola TaxID=2696063 RepID=A0A6P1TIM0_9FIRM|nr:hypothetical protein [Anaerocolumna sedimenticola]QHQ59959.1 hypothetical protein Ana3638_03485 [Anaerocolumna sedimenticola]
MGVLRVPKVQIALQWGILIMCLKTSFLQSAIIPYKDVFDIIFTVMSVVCFVISIVQERFSIKTLLLYGIVTLVSLFSVLKTGNYGFLITIIVCLAIRGQYLDKIFTLIFKLQFFFFVVHTCIAVLLFILGNLSLVLLINGVDRYCFGFRHPNSFSIYLFNLLILWTWLNYEKIKIKHIFGIFFVALVAMYFTKTRTSFIITIFFCMLLLVSKTKYSFKNLMNIIAKFIVPICAGVTLFFVKLILSGNIFAMSINTLLTGRIKLGAYGVSHFGYSLFGQDITKYNVVWDSEWGLNGFTFDNLYTYLAVNQGLVWIGMLSGLFYLLAKKGDLKISVFIIIWALYGITEVHGLNGFNCFPIFLVALLFRSGKPVFKRGEQVEKARAGIYSHSCI